MPYREEREKIRSRVYDWFKQIATLSAGSIVLLANFGTRVSSTGNQPTLLRISVVCLLTSLVASVIGSLLFAFTPTADFDKEDHGLWRLSFFGAAAGFLAGIILLGVLVYRSI